MLALALCSLARAQTVPQFSTFQPASSGLGASAPTFPAAGDFNGDGIPDVAVGDTATGTVNILLGDGSGGFQTPRPFAVGTNPQYVAVGDFNGDGFLDVVVANGDAGGTISLLLGNGDGTLQPAISIGVVANPNWLAVGDFNGDGKLDIVVTGNNSLMVLLGNGFGVFSALTPVSLLPPGVTPTILPVVVGDLDGDGNQDLIVTGPLANALFLAGNGDGTFAGPVAISPASSNPAAIGDFNGDGKLDVAVTTAGSVRNGSAAQLWVALNNGARTFTLQLVGGFSVPTGGFNLEVGNPVAADFNGDGKLDIVVKDPGTNLFLFLGNGDGTWQQAGVQGQMPSNSSATLVVADFDRNGSPDLLQPEAGNLAVLRNTHGNPPLLAQLTLNPAVAQSGATVAQGTVWLGSAAPASGAMVTLGIADPTAAALGTPTVVVLPGSASATFSIFANPVAASTSTTVSATYNGITTAATLTVLPPPPPLALASLTLDRPGVFGSPANTGVNTATATVTLNTPAINAGVVVSLTSSNPALAVLSSPTVTIGPGPNQTTGRFTITAPQAVLSDTPVTISATYQGVTQTVTLTIQKPQDTVTITKAQYDSSKKVIQVEAGSSNVSGRLGVWDTSTGQFLFSLVPTGGGKSSIQATFPSAQYPFPIPANITVRSNFGGIKAGAMAVK